ncbi:Uncharacterized protein OBRU01_04000 [Operophtera brumata]|uniref:Alpha-amylase/branching enzyme C-terminal all beta domain-containing protein n=1 Tax=Operophtera brumata TaxID=104452 RepID=A0A0L7LQ28_OPEBR|nr:Uncharacterized protein OBRU01_04000 [Operophtera brumata]
MGGNYSAMDPMEVPVPDLPKLLERDEYLKPYEREIRRRYGCFKDLYDRIETWDGGIDGFTKGYKYFGAQFNADGSIEYGKWQLHIPANGDGACPLQHGSRVQIIVNDHLYRMSPWASYVKPFEGFTYQQFIYRPDQPYQFKHPKVSRPASLRIYECHVGYNTVQLMAIMEHAYYASFGYQTWCTRTPPRTRWTASTSGMAPRRATSTPEFAARTRCGTVASSTIQKHAERPQRVGRHRGGLLPRRSPRHALAVGQSPLQLFRNTLDGLNEWDGTAAGYFHAGNRSAQIPVVQLEMDVSGMPASCRPVSEGGSGFDYRLGMAIPDMWIKLLKEQKDEEWKLGHIVHTLTNRRWMEGTVAYAESHDQALVGDKTIAFWLMDAAMYTHMSTLSEPSAVVERGLALHCMIRLITHALGGEAYLNFIGNEFGHPEWLDFPRAGNNSSYHYARRQWGLVDDALLKYRLLNNFDRDMNLAEEKYGWLAAQPVVAFERAGLLFVFNFNPSQSFTDYRVGVNVEGTYKYKQYGGVGRVEPGGDAHLTQSIPWGNRMDSIQYKQYGGFGRVEPGGDARLTQSIPWGNRMDSIQYKQYGGFGRVEPGVDAHLTQSIPWGNRMDSIQYKQYGGFGRVEPGGDAHLTQSIPWGNRMDSIQYKQYGGFGRVEPGGDAHLTQSIPWGNRMDSIQVYIPTRTAIVYAKVN